MTSDPLASCHSISRPTRVGGLNGNFKQSIMKRDNSTCGLGGGGGGGGGEAETPPTLKTKET